MAQAKIYIGAEPLHRIGEYADYVDYSSGKIVRKIKKLVLTGETSIRKEIDWNDRPCYRITTNSVLNIGTRNIIIQYANKYRAETQYVANNVYYTNIIYSVNGYLYVYVDTNYATLDSFKSYLAAQYAAGTPVTVWYVLETPNEEDPPVPLPELPTLSGINTMSVDTTVKPSQMYIKGKIKPDGYGKLTDKNGVYILDKDGIQLTVHGQGTSNA